MSVKGERENGGWAGRTQAAEEPRECSASSGSSSSANVAPRKILHFREVGRPYRNVLLSFWLDIAGIVHDLSSHSKADK